MAHCVDGASVANTVPLGTGYRFQIKQEVLGRSNRSLTCDTVTNLGLWVTIDGIWIEFDTHVHNIRKYK
jgi:hypothetical protein